MTLKHESASSSSTYRLILPDASDVVVVDGETASLLYDSDSHRWKLIGGPLVKKGMIMMWSGSIASIPTGWALCNGSNGTPDLRDKFIVGANQDASGVAKTNVTGSLTQSGGAATHSHTVDLSTNLSTVSGDNNNANVPFPGSFTTSAPTALPPYYALAYIMKL